MLQQQMGMSNLMSSMMNPNFDFASLTDDQLRALLEQQSGPTTNTGLGNFASAGGGSAEQTEYDTKPVFLSEYRPQHKYNTDQCPHAENEACIDSENFVVIVEDTH
jgi:hypothetical protein